MFVRSGLVALCLLALSGSPAVAATFNVTKTADTNDGVCGADCSLREAITAANAGASADTIVLQDGLVYTLTLGHLDLTQPLQIDGHGSTVDGSSLDRVFAIQGSFLVTINDLTITGGLAGGFLSLGGGINIRNATVVLNNSTVTGNSTADEGDGRDDGGGIAVLGTFDPAGPTTTLASLTLNHSTVSGNTGLNGGGILCAICTLTITSSTISGNTATGTDGGGIDVLGSASTLTMTGSALTGNSVTGPGGRGGGLSIPFGLNSATLTANRIVSNSASASGAIYADSSLSVGAANNWWGCNDGAGTSGGTGCVGTPNSVSSSVTATPYLKLKVSASPAGITPNTSSTATADLTFNSVGADTSAGGTVRDGTVAAFAGTLGTFATPTATTTAGKATDVYTNNGTTGTASLSATVDGQTVSTPVVIATNDPPTLNAIPDPAAILEDAGLQTVNLSGISAGGSDVQTLTVTATSNNTSLIPNPTVTYTSPNATGSLSYTPVANKSGSAIITVTVDDGGVLVHTIVRTFTVNVTPVNDQPTLDAIPDPATILEDASLQTVNLSGISAGGGESQTLTITATSNNTALIPNPTVTYTSPNATGSLSYTPVADQSGSAVITVTVTDNGGGGTDTIVRTFTVNVTAVNDPPTLDAIPDPAAILEDASLQTINLTGISAGGGESQTLTVTATSNNTALIPNPTVTYTSANATGSLSYTPVANASGSAIVTVTVDDGGSGTHTIVRTFTVNVTSVNDPPTLDAIPDPPAILEDATVQTVNLSGITTGGGESQTLTVTATSNNTALIPNPTVSYTSPNATGSLSYTPVANANGTAIVTVTVTDSGGGGTDTVTRTFTVNVTSVDDPPTLNAIPDPPAILEDAALQTVNLSGISAGGGESQTLTVKATSNNAALIPDPTVTYSSPDTTGSLSYTPVANASGSAIITVTVTDTGGGINTFTRTFTVNVTAVNDPPTLNAIPDPAAILEDAPLQTVNLSGISAGGGESQTLTVTATSSNTALIPNPTASYTSPNATGSLSYTPVANANGSAIITVTVDDAGGGTHTVVGTFTVNVTSVNDLPTLSAFADQQVPTNTALALPFTIGDVETASAALVVTATSSNQTVVPDAGLVVSAGGASRTLTITPAANQSGTATITVTVTDGNSGTATRTFVLTVQPGMSIADALMLEGNSGSANLSVQVSLSGPSATTVTAHYATRQRTAIEGADYAGVAGTVTFAPGATTATILVPVMGDTATEIDETFYVELSAVVGGQITDAQAIGTIVNDDPTSPVSAELVAWGRRTGVVTDGGSLTKTAPIGWTAGASASKGIVTGDGSVEFSATASNQTWVVGLSRSSLQYLVVGDIEYAVQLFADGTFAVVEHGVNLTGPLGSYAAGDRFAVAVAGGVLTYRRNGVTVYTGAGAPLYPLRVDTALFTPGSTIADVVLAGRLARLGGAAGDVDSDGKADLTVFRPSTGGWYTLKSGANYTTSQSLSWGLGTDVPAPGDYDGDGKLDPAIYRPSTGLWAILKSSTNYTTSMTVSWGLSTDVPVPADYDGDGKTDPAVYRPSTGGWYILKSTTNYTSSISVLWGLSTDRPLPADYDGDGQADPAIFRPSTGLWAILKSSTGYGTSMTVSWGLSTDVAVPGDYDGDGKADPAVYRPSTGSWYLLKSSTSYATSASAGWGLSTDTPVPADYDGDGKFDPAIFRPSTGLWAVLKSSTNYTTSMTVSWGLSTDTPINRRP